MIARKLLVLAVGAILLPTQIILTVCLLPLGVAAALILYPFRPGGAEKAIRMPIAVSDALRRFRLRIAGDPRASRYDDFR
jgi:hypothetical protein